MGTNGADMGAGRLSKAEGSFYTPPAVAEAIVRLSGLSETAGENSHVLDPAAGDGALLVAAIPVLACRMRELGLDDETMRERIVSNIHAIEIDPHEADRCRHNLSVAMSRALGGEPIPEGDWDVTVGDACAEWRQYEGRMDCVLMNPPYVRIHNLSSKPDSPYVTGMCDLYYAFFDYAQRVLSPHGVVSAIAPSSWMTSRAGGPMREDIRRRGVVRAICDYGHLQVFAPHATTYTSLVLIGTEEADAIRLWSHNDDGSLSEAKSVPSASCWHQGLFMPGAPPEMDAIMGMVPGAGGVSVRNGYATNLDGVFMSEESRFHMYEIPVVKASKARLMRAIYPYDGDGSLVPFADIEANEPSLARFLSDNRGRLLSRTQVAPERWWAYGRSQGIADTMTDKVAIQSLVVPRIPPRVAEAPAGTGVFGGIYVTDMGREELEEAVSSKEFFSYVMALRKYKSGGYYAFGGRDLERFLSWWRTSRRI